MLESLNLKQHVQFPTHLQGHTLDLLITQLDHGYIKSVHPSDCLSDHLCIKACLDFSVPKARDVTHTFRCFHKINITDFRNDIKASDLITNPKDTPDGLYNELVRNAQTLSSWSGDYTRRRARMRASLEQDDVPAEKPKANEGAGSRLREPDCYGLVRCLDAERAQARVWQMMCCSRS